MATPPLRADIQLYRRLWISGEDLVQALDYASKLAFEPPADHVLRRALTTAAVVSYARPFVGSLGTHEAVAMLPGKCLRVLEPEERSFHMRVIAARNAEYAHSDTDAHRVTVMVRPGTVRRASYRRAAETWLQPHMVTMVTIVQKLLDWVDQERWAVHARLPEGDYPHEPRAP